MLKAYYQTVKPGIIYGNLITAIAGFMLASRGNISFSHLIELAVGISLVIGSACVFNNYIDHGIDETMSRTKNRALVTGKISKRNALIFASLLAIVGFLSLGVYTNKLVVYIGLIAFVDYVILYGLSKRRSVHGTLVGTIAGAAPILAGYCAVTGRLDPTAILLFIILAIWQMPHFYAIAMYRFDDYKSARIPVLPVAKGMKTTKSQSMFYIWAFLVAVILLYVFGHIGLIYLIGILIITIAWLHLGIKGIKTDDSKKWARQMFRFSLIVILAFSVLISISHWTS